MDITELIVWTVLVAAAAGAVFLTVLVARGAWAVRRAARVARIEAELDRTQAELRQTILRLAEAMGAEAHEARKALIRESFLAAGTVPDRPNQSRRS